jgi:hypothetical protein
MIRPPRHLPQSAVGSSGSTPDDPALALHLYKEPTVWNPKLHLSFLRRPLFSQNLTRRFFDPIKTSSCPLVPCFLRIGRSGITPELRFKSRGKLEGISFKILSPRSLNVGCLRRFPSVNHLLYPSRDHA